MRGRRGLADERGVSEVIGAVLLFGILISLLVLVQVNAVPAQNQQVEFEHSQRVQQDMLSFDDAVVDAAMLNVPGSTQVELGARYPTRFFLLNPSPGTGTVESFAAGEVRIEGAKAPRFDNYWNGSAKTFDTRTIRYRPGYNEYQNAPVTVYEHGSLVNTFETGATIAADTGTFVQGRTITLVTVDGQFSKAAATATAVDTVPLSAPAQSVAITNSDPTGITITLPTTLPESHWDDAFADQMTAAGGSVEAVTVLPGPADSSYDSLRVRLEPGTYQAKVARVGIRGSFDRTRLGAHYLAPVGANRTESVFQSETVVLRAQVRDRFNNPVAGDVTYTAALGSFVLDDGTEVDEVTVSADADGAVAVRFTPDDSVTGTVVVDAQIGPDATGPNRERVRFRVPVLDEDVLGGADDSTSSINPVDPGTVQFESVSRDGSNVSVVFRNTGTETRTVEQLRLPFYVAGPNGKVATFAYVDGDPDARVDVNGDWVAPPDPVVIYGGNTQTISFDFDADKPKKGFFGIAIRYDEGSENYYVQIPN